MARRIKARVDHELCVGNSMCRTLAPGIFSADPDGQSVVADAEAEPLEQLLEAAGQCPVAAITVEDAETGEELY